eukprot:833399_1
MSRIIGREGGVPDFYSLRKEIIAKYGNDGPNSTKQVLKHFRGKYRLCFKQYKPLDEQHRNDDMKESLDDVVRKIISERRPMVATFKLYYPTQWNKFKNFFKINPRGILTKH